MGEGEGKGEGEVESGKGRAQDITPYTPTPTPTPTSTPGERAGVTLVECVSENGTANGYRYSGVVSDWSLATRDVQDEMVWTCEADEEDDLDVSMTVPAYARLVAKGRMHCPGCAGSCGR